MTSPSNRDSKGRFVKPATDMPRDRASDDKVNPAARQLFGWVDSPGTPMILWVFVILLAAGLLAVEFIYARHDYFALAENIGFYALWGGGSFALAVICGWPLGKILHRRDNYYGEADTTPGDIDPAHDSGAPDDVDTV